MSVDSTPPSSAVAMDSKVSREVKYFKSKRLVWNSSLIQTSLKRFSSLCRLKIETYFILNVSIDLLGILETSSGPQSLTLLGIKGRSELAKGTETQF